ncbi:MAG: carbohydrate ABC transporter permease [Oscillospiraceae bacterium]|jgi:multiple sugar transport system permease protein|nr:carbohydrate ABC transporter permease [Oscillospiraceae bacterium]
MTGFEKRESIPKSSNAGTITYKVVKYFICILLAVISIIPFYIMIMNGTRSSPEIRTNAIAFLPSIYIGRNLDVLTRGSFDPLVGLINSLIISSGATILSVYFSSLTAYGLVAYNWKLRQPFFSFIMAVMMIPAQVSAIGFYQFMYGLNMTNNYLPLIIPAIAAPGMVFFMRQYLMATLHLDIVNSARVDGSGEFHTFNRIVLPIMIPAIATQAIFSFVGNWNNLFLPMVLLTDKSKYTMPIMVTLLRGDFYRVEYGSVYIALTLTTLPLFLIYFLLSRYIIAGVALGGVKE